MLNRFLHNALIENVEWPYLMLLLFSENAVELSKEYIYNDLSNRNEEILFLFHLKTL